MGAKDKLAMIGHFFTHSFFCKSVFPKEIIKLRRCVREFKDMISDTR
jgi:hypothetical protein